jgi:hypothetical protein
MTERRSLSITDMMIGVLLVGAVVVAVKDPRLEICLSYRPRGVEQVFVRPWRRDPLWWIGPASVAASGTILLAVSVGSRLTTRRWRTFFGGMAVGGWLLFWLAFGTGDPAPLATYFLPIAWLETLVRWVYELRRDVANLPLGISWQLVDQSLYTFEAAACLLFGAACGGVALGLSESVTDHGSLYALVRRIVFAIWLPIGAALVGASLGTGLWESPHEVISPAITAALLLFGLAAMMARFGPNADRFAYGVFAAVGIIYLATAFGPWSTGLRDWLPGRWLVEQASAWFPEEGKAPYGHGRDDAIAAFSVLGQVIFAWLAALLASRLALLIRSSIHRFVTVPTSPKGESCPS